MSSLELKSYLEEKERFCTIMISTEILHIVSPERRYVVLSLHNKFNVKSSDEGATSCERIWDEKRTVRTVNLIHRWQYLVTSKFVTVIYFGQS